MQKKYCAAPWRGLHINFRGDVKTCCAGDPNMLGDLNNCTVEEILASDKMQEIRSSIKQGVLHPEYCYNCIQAEKIGNSERDWHNNVNEEFDFATAELIEHRPSIVDVRWNITCNLSCNYCGAYCSSKWAGLLKEYVDNGVRPYHLQVVDYMNKHKNHLREVALVGGEPLLLKENQAVLDVVPEDVQVTLITNMSVDFDNNRIVKLLEQRSNVAWSMSFDNVGERVEYVRYGSTWKQLDANVRRVKGYFDNLGHRGGIHAVYNLYNCTRLRELRKYADDVGINILWQTLYQPESLDPAKHTDDVRRLAIEEIDAYMAEYELHEDEQRFLPGAKQLLESSIGQPATAQEKFRVHTRQIESVFHPGSAGQFEKLWPELDQAIGGKHIL